MAEPCARSHVRPRLCHGVRSTTAAPPTSTIHDRACHTAGPVSSGRAHEVNLVRGRARIIEWRKLRDVLKLFGEVSAPYEIARPLIAPRPNHSNEHRNRASTLMRPPFTTRAAWRAQAVRAQARCAHKHPRVCALHQSVSFNSECSSEGAIRADPVDGSAHGVCACSNNAIKVQSYHADTPLEVRKELGFVVHAKKRRRRDAHAALRISRQGTVPRCDTAYHAVQSSGGKAPCTTCMRHRACLNHRFVSTREAAPTGARPEAAERKCALHYLRCIKL